MLTRYYTDSTTDLPVSARLAWQFFSKVEDWPNWCSVIRHVKRTDDSWKKGGFFLFVADLPGLPPAPLPVFILDVEPGKTLVWGIKTPAGSVRHRFSFIDLGNDQSRIHQEEWSDGLATIMMLPVGRLISRFNRQMASELEALFRNRANTK